MKIWAFALIVAALGCWPAHIAQGQTVTFDLDSATPALTPGQNVPFDQTLMGITAHFSSPQGSVYSVQSAATTFYTLTQMPGNYLMSNDKKYNSLDVLFSKPLSSITVTFATVDYQVVTDPPSDILMTAYQDSAANPPVGSATGHGSYIGDTYPEGTLTLTSPSAFNLVRITVPVQPSATTMFLLDNLVGTFEPSAFSRLSDLSAIADGETVKLVSPMVATVGSGVFPDGGIYIEEPTRCAALKVFGADGVSEGDRVTLTGTLGTDLNGERYLWADSIDSKTPGSSIRPLGILNRSMGQMTSGLLVRVWGTVTGAYPDENYCTIDDGGGPATEVSVLLDSVTATPVVGQYARVTGIATMVGVRPRGDADVQ